MAYTYSYTNALCALWFGDLFDIQQLLSRGQHTYIRIPNSEIAPKIHNETRADGSRRKFATWIIVIGSVLQNVKTINVVIGRFTI
ncbi:hypothetical protein G4B88_028783 [Cannabis sativa]|uniref:Uncharacterized protein n=1 Tax=Cannabis sativa TaxID=3483 RepID=A0A7J6FQ94_CANSA|nr:hypothetical protein G4B88_028783 [Cannabis sativa]